MSLSTGVLKAVIEFSGLDDLSLKWPNDLYWEGRKLGGMLMQTSLSGTAVQHLVFGIGINVNEEHFHDSLVNPVSLLQITGKTMDPQVLIDLLNLYLNQAYSLVCIGAWDEIHDLYQRCLYGKDKELDFLNLTTNTRFQGRVEGVTRDGRLRLRVGSESMFFLMHEIKWL